jgi:hypothetical protein
VSQVSDEESLEDFVHADLDPQQAVFGNSTTPILSSIHIVDLSWYGQSLHSYAQLADHLFIQEAFCHAAIKQCLFVGCSMHRLKDEGYVYQVLIADVQGLGV